MYIFKIIFIKFVYNKMVYYLIKDNEKNVSSSFKSKRKVSKRKVSKRKVSNPKVSNSKVSKRKVSKRKVSKVSKRKVSKRKVSKRKISKRKVRSVKIYTKEGGLSGYSLHLKRVERRKILDKLVKKLGVGNIVKKLNVLYIYNMNKHVDNAAKFKRDMYYIQKKYSS